MGKAPRFIFRGPETAVQECHRDMLSEKDEIFRRRHWHLLLTPRTKYVCPSRSSDQFFMFEVPFVPFKVRHGFSAAFGSCFLYLIDTAGYTSSVSKGEKLNGFSEYPDFANHRAFSITDAHHSHAGSVGVSFGSMSWRGNGDPRCPRLIISIATSISCTRKAWPVLLGCLHPRAHMIMSRQRGRDFLWRELEVVGRKLCYNCYGGSGRSSKLPLFVEDF